MSEQAIRRREEAARERAAHSKRVFDAAPFAPRGLDERWAGLRSIGGHGESNGRTHNLELAHCDNPWAPASPQVRVETQLVASAGSFAHYEWQAARQLVHYFWHETGVLPDDVRRAIFQTDRGDLDPFGPWDASDLPVDEATIALRVLAHDDFWVAVGLHDGAGIAIRARGWPLDQTGIVTIDDLAPYLDGSVEIVRRWRPS